MMMLQFHNKIKKSRIDFEATTQLKPCCCVGKMLRCFEGRRWKPRAYTPIEENEIQIKSEFASAREKAMVVNLEFIKAIVTAEVLLLDPLRQEVLRFVDQLRQRLPHKSVSKSQGVGQMDVQDNEMQLSFGAQWLPVPEVLQVLEIALKVVCTYLDSSVADLERDAYPVLDELVRNVSTKNLEHMRSLKSNLTSLLAWVEKWLFGKRNQMSFGEDRSIEVEQRVEII
ncbi:Magnesium transporter MRS2-4 [Camellia lanceoleosa]|uniref:Magnesium transporter MRS2-4 n=1 Tax=Camellia lanceoleosa TaxID=1840588 RepID=A0ACC0IVK9_9ERIC|nr:Magnesium transporter MRS2-4 [Camellia lanceoleosa]